MAIMELIPLVEQWVSVTQGIDSGYLGSVRFICEKPALSHQQLVDSLTGHSFTDFM